MRSLQLQNKFVNFGSLKVTSILKPQNKSQSFARSKHEAKVVTTFLGIQAGA